MNRILSRLGLTAFTLVAGTTLVAQTATTGQINGRVTYKDGSAIAGVSVRVESNQTTRSVLTDGNGHYQLGLINPGGVKVTFTKAGHITQTMAAQISIAQSTSLNVAGFAKEGGATVEVVATTSTVDASSTTTGQNFQTDTLQNIPVGRDMADVAFMTPGVTTSGFGNAAGTALGLQISISGASGAENSFSIDGLKTNDMRYGGQGVAMTNEFVDQIDVQTGGFKPEYSSMGGVFNVTTKSGSNDFAGSSWATFSPGTLSPALKRNAFYAEAAPNSVSDVGTWVGGAIVKDKFFYSLGLNYQQTSTPSSQNLSGLSVGSVSTPNYQFFGKFNYFINVDNQLTFSYFGNNQTATSNNGATLGSTSDGQGTQQSGGKVVDNTNNFNLIYDVTLTPTMYLSAKVGQSNILNRATPNSNTAEIIDSSYFQGPIAGTTFAGGAGYGQATPGTRWVSGGYGTQNHETNKSTQFSLDFNWILGSHALKMGLSDLKSKYTEDEARTGPDNAAWYVRVDSSGFAHIGERVYTNNSTANAEFQALYLQDTWQVNKELNLFYGARSEHQMQKGADGSTFMDFGFGKYIQPRLGFTWDVNGNGTSKVSGSFAKYYEQIPQRMAIRTFGNENYVQYNHTVAWNPTIATTPWTSVKGYVPGSYPATPSSNFSTGWSHDPQQDNIKLPQRVEFQLGYDQQISSSTILGIHGHYRKLTNPIEDSEITQPGGNGIPSDPNDTISGGQALLWNPHSGSVSWTDNAGKHVNVADSGYPTAFNDYKAVDFSYTRKTSSNLIYLGYTWSRNYGNYEGLISPSNGQTDGNITASYDFPAYVGTGLMPTDHTHAFKAYGYQRLKAGSGTLILGFNFLAQSGSPISKQDNGISSNGEFPNGATGSSSGSTSIGDPGNYGNTSFVNTQEGQFGRTPTTTKLDVTLHYEMMLTNKIKLEPLFEIYNLFNSRPILQVFPQATDVNGNPVVPGKWNSPVMYQSQRSFRFGVRLRF